MSDASPVETVTTPGPSAADAPAGPARPLDQLGGLEQLVEVAAADDPGRVERRVGDPRLAGQRPGMGDRGGLRLVAPADLDRHDRLAELERPVGQGEEPLGPLEPLDEQDDRARLGVVEAVGEVVADVEDDLRAAADDPREADPVARVDERVGDRARLGDPGDAAARQVRRDVADVGRAVRDEVDDAHAVRAERAPGRAPARSARPRPASRRPPRRPRPRRRPG